MAGAGQTRGNVCVRTEPDSIPWFTWVGCAAERRVVKHGKGQTMKMAILVRDVQVSPAERQRISDHVRLALARFGPVIRGLTVILNDENGTRQGVDKSCRLVVRLRGGTVVVNERAEALMAAVGQAAERATRAVARLHHRTREARRGVRRADASGGALPA
jgi:ribosome-associated translation inhibitor RaiA